MKVEKHFLIDNQKVFHNKTVGDLEIYSKSKDFNAKQGAEAVFIVQNKKVLLKFETFCNQNTGYMLINTFD